MTDPVERVRMFGGIPRDGLDLCREMTYVMNRLFGGIDYADPPQKGDSAYSRLA